MTEPENNAHKVTVPVLLIAFRRYDNTKLVIDTLREAKVSRVYFSCDGGRNEEEWQQVERVRSLVDQFDWDCELITKFNSENRGCRYNPSESISWFFDNEPEGIILEDDIIADVTFFSFCQELLAKYRDDSRIWAINGHSWATTQSAEHDDSYYFSSHSYGAYWGWATWARTWNKFDLDMKQWPEVKKSGLLNDYYLSNDEARHANHFFDISWGGFDTWDYQFDFAKIINNGLNIVPSISLTRNIGFEADATHTFKKEEIHYRGNYSSMKFPLVHPKCMLVNTKRELRFFRRFIKPRWMRRMKNFVRSILPRRLNEIITANQWKMHQ